ncbi:MAG: hypothetical protein QM764_22780 [Chitinophagaceae bacterium]
MIKRFWILFCAFSLAGCLNADIHAQDSLRKIKMPVHIQGNFFYDFPQSFGAVAGIELPLKNKVISRVDTSGKVKLKYRDWVLNGNVGFYRYTFNHTGLFLFPSIGKRYNKGRPYYFEWLLSVGLLRTFYDGQVYSVDDNGTVKQLKNYGRFYTLTGVSTVFGHDFEKNKKPKPFAIDIKPSLWFQYPYNSFVLPHLSFELQLKYHLDRLNMRVREKYVVHKLKE